MIVHMLVGKPREGLSATETTELEDAVFGLRRVPDVLSMSCGRDFSGRGKGYTLGAVINFASREHMTRYQRDPEHLRIVDVFNRLMPDRLFIDYETNAGSDL